MTTLSDQALGLLDGAKLNDSSRMGVGADQYLVRRGLVSGTSMVIAELATAIEDPVRSAWLTDVLVELSTALGGISIDALSLDDRTIELANSVLTRLWGQEAGTAAAQLGHRLGLPAEAGRFLLDASAAAVLVSLANDLGARPTTPEITAHLRRSSPAAAGATDPSTVGVPPGAGRSPSATQGVPGALSLSRPVEPGRAALAPRPRGRTEIDDRRSLLRRYPWAGPLGVVALLAIGAALALVVRSLTGSDPAEGGPPSGSDESGRSAEQLESAVVEPDEEQDDDEDEEGSVSNPSVSASTGSDLGLVVVDQALADPLGRTDATGRAAVSIDPESGEICFEFDPTGLGSPYDGHIHVGPPGVKGGIVVDFGELSGPATGCLDNRPVDSAAILDDLPGHYVEFHDPDGVNTIRAQLAPFDPDLELPDDPDRSEGAVIVVRPGRITLEGEVPDQVTIDKLIETFDDVDLGATELVDELVIVPGATRPSGLIRVEGAVLFDFDSDRIADGDNTVLADLATLFRARPAWSLRIVGHTDSVGSAVYNLELSLRRAEAVRAALENAGVAPDALITEGAGDTDPVATNETPEGRASNRRIEFEVTAG